MPNPFEEIPIGDEQLSPPPTATVKLQPGFEKVYVLRHGAKIRADIVAITTDKELADEFDNCNHNRWFAVETRIVNSVDDLRDVVSLVQAVGPKKSKKQE